MKEFRRIWLTIATVAIVLVFSMCNDDPNKSRVPDLPDKPIVILYENDVHCAVDGYSKLVAQRKSEQGATPYVSTVSCGDYASGNIVGLVSQGEYIVKIMNKVGYDVAVVGNHELDYGMPQMLKLTEKLEAPTVCANLINCQTQEHIYPAYHIVKYGDVEIAYIGFTTTTSGTVKSLSDENGNTLYSFMRDEFYENAQHWIDDARDKGADYVIALAHLGDMERGGGHPSSLGLIANTTGLNAVIDGHDHHVIEEKMVVNKEGHPVLLTSSGTGFQYLGRVELTPEGDFKSSLIDIHSDGTAEDNEIKEFVKTIKGDAEAAGEQVVGYNEVQLSIYDEEGNRLVRKQETNIGDLCSDAIRAFTGADVAMLNGGGIRADLKKGEITINDLYKVMPFGDMIYTATMTGQQLLDALEFAVSFLPNEAGVFMQVSGMKYEVDPSLPTPAVMDEGGEIFSHIGEGSRRVSNLQIWDKDAKAYKDVELARTYTVSSFEYLIAEMGGDGIFRYATPIDQYWGTEVECVVHYIKEVLNGKIGSEYANPQGRIIFK